MGIRIHELDDGTESSSDGLLGDELIEISRPSATVTMTETTLSASVDSDGAYYLDSADGFITAGFDVGDSVRVQGFTDDGNNVFTARITALTAGVMTIGGDDGAGIVDEAAGDTVTITRWESRRASVQDVLDLVPEATGGSTQGAHDISIPAGSWYADTTAPPQWGESDGASDKPDVKFWNFSPSSEQAIWTCLKLPKAWNEGTITFHVDWWYGSTPGANGIVWSMRAVAVGDGDSLAPSYGTAQTSTDTGTATNTLHKSPESAAITVAGSPVAHDLVFLELRRKTGDASDTLDVNAGMLHVNIRITTDADTDA